jgi:hypothetical protein
MENSVQLKNPGMGEFPGGRIFCEQSENTTMQISLLVMGKKADFFPNSRRDGKLNNFTLSYRVRQGPLL